MENIVNEPALNYNYISPDEYLAGERSALDKHEYYQGEVFAMSGASLQHNMIFANLFIDIGSKLKRQRLQALWQRFKNSYFQKHLIHLS